MPLQNPQLHFQTNPKGNQKHRNQKLPTYKFFSLTISRDGPPKEGPNGF